MIATQQIYYVPDLMKIAGRSRQWVQESIRDNTIPKPIRIGKRNGWPKAVIDKLFGLDTAAAQPATTSEASK